MTKNQALVIDSWTSPAETTLLLVSRKPISAEALDRARIEIVEAICRSWRDPKEDLPAMGDGRTRHHRRLKRFLNKHTPLGFQILEVGMFTII